MQFMFFISVHVTCLTLYV